MASSGVEEMFSFIILVELNGSQEMFSDTIFLVVGSTSMVLCTSTPFEEIKNKKESQAHNTTLVPHTTRSIAEKKNFLYTICPKNYYGGEQFP